MSAFGDFAILATTMLAVILLIYRMKNHFGLVLSEEESIKKGKKNAPAGAEKGRSIDPWDDEIEREMEMRTSSKRKTANSRRRPSRKYCKQVLRNMTGVEKA